MKRLAIPLSILAVAAVAACSEPAIRPAMDPQGAPIVPQAVSYRSGTGVVQNVLLTPGPIAAASGGTATGGQPSNYAGRLNRLAIKMDSGGDVQYVDTDSNDFQRGDRIELTPDRLIRKVP